MADPLSSNESALEESNLLVFRVPGLAGDRLDVRLNDGKPASSIRIRGELALVVPVEDAGKAHVEVFDRSGEVMGRATIDVRPLTGLVIDRHQAGPIPVTVSTFDVRVTRHDPIGDLAGPTRLHADFVTPSGEPITVRDLAWTLRDRDLGTLEIDPRDPRDVIFTQRIDRPAPLDICTESATICWDGTLPVRNYAGVIRRTGFITTDVSLADVSSGDFTIAMRFLAQYPRSYEGPLLSNNSIGSGDGFGVSIGDDTTGADEQHADEVAMTLRLGTSITRYVLSGFDSVVPTRTWDSTHPTHAPTPTTNQWHHLALVGTGSTLKLYIDGTERLSDMNTRATLPATPLGGFLTLGRRPIAPGEHAVQFYGLVDDLAIFSTAKSDNDIAWLNNDKTITGSEPGLVRAVTFDGPDSRPFIAQPTQRDESWMHIVTGSRNAALDAAALPLPFQQTTFVLPFVSWEVWAVTQEFANDGTHRNRAAFAWDFVRIPAGTPPAPNRSGHSYGARVLSMITGSVATFGNDGANADWLDVLSSSSLSAGPEFGFFHHLVPGSERPLLGDIVDSNTVLGQSEFGLHVGSNDVSFGGFHLSQPIAFSEYDVSRDYGVTWQYVAVGMPRLGEWVRRHTPNGRLIDPVCDSVGGHFYGC